MLARIFGGVAAVLYLILKTTADALLATTLEYAPPTFPIGGGAVEQDGTATGPGDSVMNDTVSAGGR
eukprot:COSAG01_NODE_226_length_21147_cov_59.226435_20_plen_67_part_00